MAARRHLDNFCQCSGVELNGADKESDAQSEKETTFITTQFKQLGLQSQTFKVIDFIFRMHTFGLLMKKEPAFSQ